MNQVNLSAMTVGEPATAEDALTRKALVAAFFIQLALVIFCVVSSLVIYRDYKLKLQAEIQDNNRLASQLLTLQNQINQDKVTIRDATLSEATTALEAKQYPYAAQIANDGLKISPQDPYFSWVLVKSLVLQGNVQGALKVAESLRTDGLDERDASRNWLTIGLAKCAAKDDIGAIEALIKSNDAQHNVDDVSAFCSSNVRRRIGSEVKH
jgi:hypothetical protein